MAADLYAEKLQAELPPGVTLEQTTERIWADGGPSPSAFEGRLQHCRLTRDPQHKKKNVRDRPPRGREECWPGYFRQAIHFTASLPNSWEWQAAWRYIRDRCSNPQDEHWYDPAIVKYLDEKIILGDDADWRAGLDELPPGYHEYLQNATERKMRSLKDRLPKNYKKDGPVLLVRSLVAALEDLFRSYKKQTPVHEVDNTCPLHFLWQGGGAKPERRTALEAMGDPNDDEGGADNGDGGGAAEGGGAAAAANSDEDALIGKVNRDAGAQAKPLSVKAIFRHEKKHGAAKTFLRERAKVTRRIGGRDITFDEVWILPRSDLKLANQEPVHMQDFLCELCRAACLSVQLFGSVHELAYVCVYQTSMRRCWGQLRLFGAFCYGCVLSSHKGASAIWKLQVFVSAAS